MKKKTWKDKLTKKELKHLKEDANVTNLAGLELTFKDQAKMRKLFPKTEPCWDCKFIAQKLGYEV